MVRLETDGWLLNSCKQQTFSAFTTNVGWYSSILYFYNKHIYFIYILYTHIAMIYNTIACYLNTYICIYLCSLCTVLGIYMIKFYSFFSVLQINLYDKNAIIILMVRLMTDGWLYWIGVNNGHFQHSRLT